MSPRVIDPNNSTYPPNVGNLLAIRDRAYVWDGEMFVDMGPMEEFLSGSNKDVMEGKPTAASTDDKPSELSE